MLDWDQHEFNYCIEITVLTGIYCNETNFVSFSLVLHSKKPLMTTTTQHTTAQSMLTVITVGKTQLGVSVATAAKGSGGDVSEYKAMNRYHYNIILKFWRK